MPKAAHVTLDEDGRVALPAAMREELGLRPGDTLVVESDGVSLLLHKSGPAPGETQGLVPPRGSEPQELTGHEPGEAAGLNDPGRLAARGGS